MLEDTFGQLLGLEKVWRVVVDRLEASYLRFLLKVWKTVSPWPEESA
jgi:hypothetical protein